MDRVYAGFFRILPRVALSGLVGRLARWEAPRFLLRPAISAYVAAFQVDLGEAVVPAGGWRSFVEFFCRELRPGARPVDPDPASVVSPADGMLAAAGPVEDGVRLVVKGHAYGVGELLGSQAEAPGFAGGRFAVVYLSPRDYHRVHSPAEARVERVIRVPGTLYPVNRVGLERVKGLFARNRRASLLLRTAAGRPVGVILVGALMVGGVRLAAEPDSGAWLAKGGELGAFELGSTVVVLLPEGAELAGLEPGATIRMGQRIARLDPEASRCHAL